jgi:hypothetical protein
MRFRHRKSRRRHRPRRAGSSDVESDSRLRSRPLRPGGQLPAHCGATSTSPGPGGRNRRQIAAATPPAGSDAPCPRPANRSTVPQLGRDDVPSSAYGGRPANERRHLEGEQLRPCPCLAQARTANAQRFTTFFAPGRSAVRSRARFQSAPQLRASDCTRIELGTSRDLVGPKTLRKSPGHRRASAVPAPGTNNRLCVLETQPVRRKKRSGATVLGRPASHSGGRRSSQASSTKESPANLRGFSVLGFRRASGREKTAVMTTDMSTTPRRGGGSEPGGDEGGVTRASCGRTAAPCRTGVCAYTSERCAGRCTQAGNTRTFKLF